MYKKIIPFLIFTILCVQIPCFATVTRKTITKETSYYSPSEWPKEKLYIDRAFGKMAYGVWNFLMWPFVIAKEPYESYVLGDSVIVGAGRGILYAACDFAGGFLNFITFPITALKIPLPKGGAGAREF